MSTKTEAITATNLISVYNPVINLYKYCPFLLTYIDTFHNSVRMCVCVLIEPEVYFFQKFFFPKLYFMFEQLRPCVGGAFKKTE
jgi:hypothetical protein